MEPAAAADGESPDPPPSPPPEGPPSADTSSSSTAATGAQAPAPPGAREVAAAMEAVERDAAAIAKSYASLFASLRVALSNVTSTSVENMDCLGDDVGRLQESALEASSKGNKYINSCLRLNEEMRGLESLAMQLVADYRLFSFCGARVLILATIVLQAVRKMNDTPPICQVF